MAAKFFEFQQNLIASQREAAKPKGEPISVRELTTLVDKAIRGGLPAKVMVKGEVSNHNRHAGSGHHYFTLKDSAACIDCMMFKSIAERVRFQLTDGLEVVATGRVQVYAARGRYQLYVDDLTPAGQGSLELAFRQLHAKLAAEGLFAAERKKPIPKYPQRIAIITSRQAAALHDVLKVLRRYPWLKLFVFHVPVQGAGCGQEIAAAVRRLSESHASIGGIDVMLLVRGGGSLEDLWGFNDESLARAIADSTIPIVSGIGHEVDVSIADLVADHHAHTPTAAAEWVTSKWKATRDALEYAGTRLRRGLAATANDARRRLTNVERHEFFRRPTHRIDAMKQGVDERERALLSAMRERLRTAEATVRRLADRLAAHGPAALVRTQHDRLHAMERTLNDALRQALRNRFDRTQSAAGALAAHHPKHRVQLLQNRLASIETRLTRGAQAGAAERVRRIESLSRQLEAMNPRAVLRRGYSITTRKRDGAVVRRPSDVRPGDRLVTQVADGQVESTVEDARQLALFE